MPLGGPFSPGVSLPSSISPLDILESALTCECCGFLGLGLRTWSCASCACPLATSAEELMVAIEAHQASVLLNRYHTTVKKLLRKARKHEEPK